jgi:hypothetical protein
MRLSLNARLTGCLALLFAVATSHPSRAQDVGPGIFHAQATTAACADPRGTHALTNPDDKRRTNPAWVKSTYRNAHCVTVTSVSPWKLVRRDGSLALMAYSGTVGAPGAYWFDASVLADSQGARPGESPGSSIAASTPAQAPADARAAALAPTPAIEGAGIAPEANSGAGRDLLFVWATVGLVVVAAIAAYMLRHRHGRGPRRRQ